MLLILFFPLALAFAQEDFELRAIQKLGDDIPDYQLRNLPEKENAIHRQHSRYKSPIPNIGLKDIEESGIQKGAIREDHYIHDIHTHKSFKIMKPIYVNYYKQEDEFGYKYIVNKDGSCRYKIPGDKLVMITEETKLYEPPANYTPAPENVVTAEYDKKLKWKPEASFYAGAVQGDYMKDLFDDPKANKGISTQYGVHALADWNIPIKAGAVIHYERTEYRLSQNGVVTYSSLSLGPQFRTKDFDLKVFTFRLQTQYRVSPNAIAHARTQIGNADFRFNSADSLTSAEFPFKNSWGEFVLSLYGQYQWLSIKEQKQNLNLKASNETNKSWGLALSQVFE